MQAVNQFYQYLKRGPSSIIHLIFFYRFISLSLTSIFYLLGPLSPMYFKVGVVGSLCIAAWIITDIQRKYFKNITILKLTVLAEIVGLTLLLIPTGGISSLFIWYALNPVLVAASFLSTTFCWGALTFYLGSATIITYNLFNIENIGMILQEKSYFFLVCLLITMLIRMFSGLTNELNAKTVLLKSQQEELVNMNSILTVTNQKYQQTLEHVMSLYQLVENFHSKKSINKLVIETASALQKCMQSNEVFFWITDFNKKNSVMENLTNNQQLEKDLIENWNDIRTKRRSFIWKINNDSFLVKVIRSSNNVGVIGVKVTSEVESINVFPLYRPFKYLAELSEIMLEKLHLDEMMDQMIIIEEQNRIANEIHDSVSQRLFGIVCALHSLQVKGQNMTREELNKEFRFLSQSANTTIKELRSAIYQLSSVKKGEQPFLSSLRSYLDDFARLNDINIDYQFSGEEALVTEDIKHSLYRIISEACGNAVRHGESSKITLKLSLTIKKSVLVIQDNGKGMNGVIATSKSEKGIGLMNMRNIVHSYSGLISINGRHGNGTKLHIEIPNVKVLETWEATR